MSVLRCLALLKKKRREPVVHKGQDALIMKPPDAKRAKIEKDRRLISDLLDGVFQGINTDTNTRAKIKQEVHEASDPSPLIHDQPSLSDRLTSSILSWVKRIISDSSDSSISAVGFHGCWAPWLEVSSRRGVIWKGPSLLPSELLDPRVDTKSETIYTEYVTYLVNYMLFQLPTLPIPAQSSPDSTMQYGYMFFESSDRHIQALVLPKELRMKLKPHCIITYTPSEAMHYISSADLVYALGIVPQV